MGSLPKRLLYLILRLRKFRTLQKFLQTQGPFLPKENKIYFFNKNFEFLDALEIDPNADIVQALMGLLDMFKVLVGPKNFWAEISTYPPKAKN